MKNHMRRPAIAYFPSIQNRCKSKLLVVCELWSAFWVKRSFFEQSQSNYIPSSGRVERFHQLHRQVQQRHQDVRDGRGWRGHRLDPGEYRWRRRRLAVGLVGCSMADWNLQWISVTVTHVCRVCTPTQVSQGITSACGALRSFHLGFTAFLLTATH